MLTGRPGARGPLVAGRRPARARPARERPSTAGRRPSDLESPGAVSSRRRSSSSVSSRWTSQQLVAVVAVVEGREALAQLLSSVWSRAASSDRTRPRGDDRRDLVVAEIRVVLEDQLADPRAQVVVRRRGEDVGERGSRRPRRPRWPQDRPGRRVREVVRGELEPLVGQQIGSLERDPQGVAFDVRGPAHDRSVAGLSGPTRSRPPRRAHRRDALVPVEQRRPAARPSRRRSRTTRRRARRPRSVPTRAGGRGRARAEHLERRAERRGAAVLAGEVRAASRWRTTKGTTGVASSTAPRSRRRRRHGRGRPGPGRAAARAPAGRATRLRRRSEASLRAPPRPARRPSPPPRRRRRRARPGGRSGRPSSRCSMPTAVPQVATALPKPAWCSAITSV
jgi:hypothetical protein